MCSTMLKIRVFIIGLSIAVLVVTGCGRKEPPKTDPVPAEEQGEASSTGTKKDSVEHKVLSFNLEGLTDKGDKKWEVIGRTARSISENEISLGNIVAKTYGDQEAIITADEGIYDKSKNNVRLEKNVKAVIENAGSVIRDQMGFPIDTVSSGKAAKSEKPGEKKKITITCDGDVEFNYAKNLAYFRKNVKVRSEDGDIDADKITVNLDPGTKKINDIIAEGNVKITQKENIAYSDKAKYNESDKIISLTGNPKIEMVQEEGDGSIKDNFMKR